MPDRNAKVGSPLMEEFLYTPETQSERYRRHHHHHSGSVSAQSRSLEENQPNYIHGHAKYFARQSGRAPSPATHIDQLRRVLTGAPNGNNENVPEIEVNGLSVNVTDMSATYEEKEQDDVTDILESLKLNGEWNEKRGGDLKGKVDGIRPPYVV